MTPYVQNTGTKTAYYKVEGFINGVNVNPNVNHDIAHPIEPGTDLYTPVDGVNVEDGVKEQVFRVPTGARIIIWNNNLPSMDTKSAALAMLNVFESYFWTKIPYEQKGWVALRDIFKSK